MPITDKLAYEIYIILIFHLPAILILIAFCTYIYFKANKTPVLFSFLALAAMLLIWMVSKVFKTVSPDENLRWVFIVCQYFGVQFLGVCLVIFAYIYTKNKVPSNKTMIILGVFPLASFIAVLTNPLHMQFYSHYDFYKDSFGKLFLPIQSIQYVYLIAGVVMLSKGFTRQPSFAGRRGWARLFATLTIFPLLANCYYILFKMDVFEWIFPFPVFDFSPIAGTMALILFTIPALRFKFFDISPVSYRQIFNHMQTGIVFIASNGTLFSPNKAFNEMFSEDLSRQNINRFAEHFLKGENASVAEKLFFSEINSSAYLKSNDGKYYFVRSMLITGGVRLFSFSDVTDIAVLEKNLSEKNQELVRINSELVEMSGKSAELSATRIKSAVAQNVHDILGHSLTVAICTSELAVRDMDCDEVRMKLEIIYDLLSASLDDLKKSVQGSDTINQTSLTKAILSLKNPGIELDLVAQGSPYELDTTHTEAIFRICQEALTNSIKHGKASSIHIFLRYYKNKFEIFIIDNGVGCTHIKKSYGLIGMESRTAELGGELSFGSDGGGFHIYARFNRPKN